MNQISKRNAEPALPNCRTSRMTRVMKRSHAPGPEIERHPASNRSSKDRKRRKRLMMKRNKRKHNKQKVRKRWTMMSRK